MPSRTPALPPRPVVAAAAAAAVTAAAALLGGCMSPVGRLDPRAAPTLEREWTVPGRGLKPGTTSEHHWLTPQHRRDGVGWGTRSTFLGVTAVDARTGQIQRMEQRDDLRTCVWPAAISPDGLAPLLVTPATQPEPSGAHRCSHLAVFDVSTGEVEVIGDDLDLRSLTTPLSLAVDNTLAAVVDPEGRAVCRRLDDGAEVATDAPACRALRDRHTRADLPALVDSEGQPAPLGVGTAPDDDQVELGRTDEVLLVRAFVEEAHSDGSLTARYVVRAHDLETGETLWQDDDLTPDPYVVDSWSRQETYFVAPSGVARVTYEHPDDELLVSSTPMVVTAVDPRTGEQLTEVARLDGAWFAGQFGTMTVALTSQELRLRATISGYVLPDW